MSEFRLAVDGDDVYSDQWGDESNIIVQLRMKGPAETVGLVRDGEDMLLSFTLAPGGVQVADLSLSSTPQPQATEPVRTGEDAEQPEASAPENRAEEAADEDS